ncbi:MAG: hypothetical protein ACR2P2_02045 [Nakamurella sp.]
MAYSAQVDVLHVRPAHEVDVLHVRAARKGAAAVTRRSSQSAVVGLDERVRIEPSWAE